MDPSAKAESPLVSPLREAAAVVLADGPASRQFIGATLGNAEPGWSWIEAADRHAFSRLIDRRRPPLAIVARSVPLASPTDLDQLPDEFPDTTFVQLLGTWCEGEGRTGRVVEGYQRVFWSQWPAWWRHWAEVDDQPRLPAWDGVVVVAARSPATTDALRDWLAPERQLATLRETPSDSVVGAVWEGTQLGGIEAAALAGFARQLPRWTPLVVLLDFPRRETVAAAYGLGATTILGKPFDGDRLRDGLALVPSRPGGVPLPVRRAAA